MFSLTSHCKDPELAAFLDRLMALTSPNSLHKGANVRSDDRSNRTIPVLLTPWEDGQPVLDETSTALTKDISANGLSIVLHQPFHSDDVVIGFWLTSQPRFGLGNDPRFAIGKIRQNISLGGGFWQVGIELNELHTAEEMDVFKPLLPWAVQLIPSKRDEAAQSVAEMR